MANGRDKLGAWLEERRGTAAFSFAELCAMLGRESPYVHNLQRQLGLYIPGKGGSYSQSYLVFMEKIVSLRALHVPQDEILALFETEKKVLHLLHVDTLTLSPTWYLDACASGNEDDQHHNDPAPDRLLLSGYRLGFRLDEGPVQPTLDFGQRETELFKGHEMGEDVRRVLQKYLGQLAEVRKRVQRERPVLENALLWVRKAMR
jgi:hypothetical protein